MSDQTVDELRGHLNQVIHNLQPYGLSSAALKLRRASHTYRNASGKLLLMRNSIKQRCAC